MNYNANQTPYSSCSIPQCESIYFDRMDKDSFYWLEATSPYYMYCTGNVFRRLCRRPTRRFLYDRFGLINSSFPFLSPTPKPIYLVPASKSMEAAYESVAHLLLNSYDSIGILWSGGVDSTFIIAQLIDAGAKKDQLRIFCTGDIEDENPRGYKRLVSDGWDVIKLTSDRWSKQPQKFAQILSTFDDELDIIITGNAANQILGENPQIYMDPNALMNYKDGFIRGLEPMNFFIERVNDFNERLDEWFANLEIYRNTLCPGIERLCEMLNLIHYGVNYNYWAPEINLDFISAGFPELAYKTESFYSYPIILSTALEHLQKINMDYQMYISPSAERYGMFRKKLILKIFGDVDWCINTHVKSSYAATHDTRMFNGSISVFKNGQRKYERLILDDSDIDRANRLNLTPAEYLAGQYFRGGMEHMAEIKAQYYWYNEFVERTKNIIPFTPY